MRELPKAAGYQQTLLTSFTLGGIGLHTGKYAFLRVRPAYAGEGRYFVRVPEGTNSSRFQLEDEPEALQEPTAQDLEPNLEVERLKVDLFMGYLRAQETQGFDGTFDEWVQELSDAELPSEARQEILRASAASAEQLAVMEGSLFDDTPEDIEARAEGEGMSATLENVFEVGMPYTQLGTGDDRILSVEHLMAALEACGVDNARIELEGGPEVPMLDGSALGWSLEIQQAGLRPAVTQANEQLVPRLSALPPTPVAVARGDAWVAFYPGYFTKLSYGLDCQDASPVIGQQWYTWRADQDYHFRYELAPARPHVESVDELVAMRDAGYVQGGSQGGYVIGYGDRWWDPQNVRFHNDEPSRHKLIDLIGDLALMAAGGNGGLPLGHVVAYNADHGMHVQLARAIYETLGEDDYAEGADVAEAQDALLEEHANRFKRAVRRRGGGDGGVEGASPESWEGGGGEAEAEE